MDMHCPYAWENITLKKKNLEGMPGNSEAFAWVKPVCAVIQKIAVGVSVN